MGSKFFYDAHVLKIYLVPIFMGLRARYGWFSFVKICAICFHPWLWEKYIYLFYGWSPIETGWFEKDSIGRKLVRRFEVGLAVSMYADLIYGKTWTVTEYPFGDRVHDYVQNPDQMIDKKINQGEIFMIKLLSQKGK